MMAHFKNHPLICILILLAQNVQSFLHQSTTITALPILHRSSSCLMSTLIVAEDPLVSLGASLAIATNDALQNIQNKIPDDETTLAVTRASSSSCFMHQQQIDFGIVHVLLKSKEDAENVRQAYFRSTSCLGIQVAVDHGGAAIIAPETAQSVGTLLQEILYAHNEGIPNITMTLDLPLHLALLQANALPKTPQHNTFHVLVDETTAASIEVEYAYDWSNPFGGTDPLACSSREICVSAVPSSNSQVQAAAYTALKGSPDLTTDSLGIAASVATIMAQHSVTEYSVNAVKDIVNYYVEQMHVSEENGILRQKYIEFGYK